MRQIEISVGEHYHICNRGNDKQIIFRDDRDRVRFLLLLFSCQSELSFHNLSRYTARFLAQGSFGWNQETKDSLIKTRFVELVSFILMPNHFHLLVLEAETGGIARYLQRVLNAYTKYFNTRHERNGHLFSGPYRIVPTAGNDQLLYVSAYIHRNCHELKSWHNRSLDYPWSSYQDYVIQNRWDKLLSNTLILEQFSNGQEYHHWVETSGAKDEEEYQHLNLDNF